MYGSEFYNKCIEESPGDRALQVGWLSSGSVDARFRKTISLFSDLEGSRFLDYGCGASLNAIDYLPDSVDYQGVDINSRSLEVANTIEGIERFREFKLTSPAGVEGTYDNILVQGVYQEFPDMETVYLHLGFLCTHLDPEGELVLTVPCNDTHVEGSRSVLRFSVYDLVSILERLNRSYTIIRKDLGTHLIVKIGTIVKSEV